MRTDAGPRKAKAKAKVIKEPGIPAALSYVQGHATAKVGLKGSGHAKVQSVPDGKPKDTRVQGKAGAKARGEAHSQVTSKDPATRQRGRATLVSQATTVKAVREIKGPTRTPDGVVHRSGAEQLAAAERRRERPALIHALMKIRNPEARVKPGLHLDRTPLSPRERTQAVTATEKAQADNDRQDIKRYGTPQRQSGSRSDPAAKTMSDARQQAQKDFTPVTKVTLKRLERYGAAGEAKRIRGHLLKSGGKSVSAERANEIKRATDPARAQKAMEDKRAHKGQAPKNAARDAKDLATNFVPIGQELAATGAEIADSAIFGSGHGGMKHTRKLVKETVQGDPYIQTALHGPRAGARAAILHPWSVLPGAGMAARVLRKSNRVVKVANRTDLTLRKGKLVDRVPLKQRVYEHELKLRARPTQVVPHAKDARPVAKGEAGRDRHKQDVRDTRDGKVATGATTGPTRQYSDRVSVRAAQKAKDTVQASRGKDPIVVTGRTAKKIINKDTTSVRARQKIVHGAAEGDLQSGRTVDEGGRAKGPDVLNRGPRAHQKLERDADARTNTLAHEIFGHLRTTPDDRHPPGPLLPHLESRIKTLQRQVGDPKVLRRDAQEKRAAQLRNAGEKDAGRIARLSRQYADRQVANAQHTLGVLQKAHPQMKATQDARGVLEAAKLKTAHALKAVEDAGYPSGRAVNTAADRAGREQSAAQKAYDAVLHQDKGWVANAFHLSNGRERTAEHLNELDRRNGLSPESEDLRLRQQYGVAHDLIEKHGDGWRKPVTHEPVSIEQIATLPRASNYVHYGDQTSTHERVIGQSGPGKGFTGGGVHGHDAHTRTLGVQQGERLAGHHRNEQAAHYLKQSYGGPAGSLSHDAGVALAAHLSKKTSEQWVTTPAGRVDPTSVRHAHDHEIDLAGPKEGETGVVVMRAPLDKLWREHIKPEGRVAAAGKIINRAFIRGVLPLNPLFNAGNVASTSAQVAVAGGRKYHLDLLEGVRHEAGLEPFKRVDAEANTNPYGISPEPGSFGERYGQQDRAQRIAEREGRVTQLEAMVKAEDNPDRRAFVQKVLASVKRDIEGIRREGQGDVGGAGIGRRRGGQHDAGLEAMWDRNITDELDGHQRRELSAMQAAAERGGEEFVMPSESMRLGSAKAWLEQNLRDGANGAEAAAVRRMLDKVQAMQRANTAKFAQDATPDPQGPSDAQLEAINNEQPSEFDASEWYDFVDSLKADGEPPPPTWMEKLTFEQFDPTAPPPRPGLHPKAKEVFDSLGGHALSRAQLEPRTAKAVFRNKPLKDGTPSGGRMTDLGEKLHSVGKLWTGRYLVRKHSQLSDWTMSASAQVEQHFVRLAEGVGLERVARELNIDVKDHQALAHRLLTDPAAADRFHEHTLSIVGDYVRQSAKMHGWRGVPVPFLPWIRAAAKWTFHTLPADHPVKMALYVQAAVMTEEERRKLGMSDWITDAEAKSMGLPALVDGFLGGAANMGPGWVAPLNHLFAPAEAAMWLDNFNRHAGQSLFPQVAGIIGRGLGHAGGESTFRLQQATDKLGITDHTAKNIGGGALEAGMRFLYTYVAGAARVASELGVKKGIDGGLGPTQSGSYDDQGNAISGRPKNLVLDKIGVGAQSIMNDTPPIGVSGVHQVETPPRLSHTTMDPKTGVTTVDATGKAPVLSPGASMDPVTGDINVKQGSFTYDRLRDSYQPGQVNKRDEIADSQLGPEERSRRDLARVIADQHKPRMSMRQARILKGDPSAQASERAEVTRRAASGVDAPMTHAQWAKESAKYPKGDYATWAQQQEMDAPETTATVRPRAAPRTPVDPARWGKDLAGPPTPSAATHKQAVHRVAAAIMHQRAKKEPSGIVKVPFAPNEEISGSILNEVVELNKRYGVQVSDGYDRDRSAGHKSPGHNKYGDAVDFTGTADQTNKVADWAVKRGYTVYYDGSRGTTAAANHGPGHHIHVEFASGPHNARTGMPPPTELGSDAAPTPLGKQTKRATATVTGGGPWRVKARRAAISHGIDPDVFERMIQQESGFQPRIGTNGSGATGIAQIIASTAKAWKVDPTDPDAALKVAARELARYVKRYGSYERALSAYNSGQPDKYKDPSFAKGQTYNYVRIIMGGGGSTGTPSGGSVASEGSSGTPGSPTGSEPTDDVSRILNDPALSNEDRTTRLQQLLATLQGGTVNADGTITPARKVRARKTTGPSSTMDPVSAETKRLRARIAK